MACYLTGLLFAQLFLIFKGRHLPHLPFRRNHTELQSVLSQFIKYLMMKFIRPNLLQNTAFS